MRSDLIGRVIVLSATLVITSIGSGCDMSCDGGTWETSSYTVCTADKGSVELNAPARYGLPPTLSVSAHTSLESSGPGFDVGCNPPGPNKFCVNVILPWTEIPTTYALPVVASSDVALHLYVSAPDNLNLVSGSINVAISSREELRASFTMDFEDSTTGERYSLANGTADVSGCHPVAQPYCNGGD